MSLVFLQSLLGVSIVSLISIIGIIALALPLPKLRFLTAWLVSISAGTLLGGAFFHLLPDSLENAIKFQYELPQFFALVLGGIIVFYLLEKIICWRHCHIPTSSQHPHHLGKMNLIGDALHNLLDGIIIASAFKMNLSLGISTTLAVVMHEIPQEIADFGVLLYAGYSHRRAIWLNFLISLTSFLGIGIAFWLDNLSIHFNLIIMTLTAGAFIYIATADMMPELIKEHNGWKSGGQLLAILAGILFMFFLAQ